MKKLSNIAAALAHNTLSKRDMTLVKGGTDPLPTNPLTEPTLMSLLDDEKRRERPGGGINTN